MTLNFGSEFLENLAAHASDFAKHLPTLTDLEKVLEFRIPKLREQVETAYPLMFIEIRSRMCTRTLSS